MSNEITADVALKLGLESQKRGMLREAEAFYHKVIDAEPDNADAFHLLGMLALEIKDYEVAKDLILHAIDLNNGVPLFYNNLGNVFIELEQYDVARECFHEAVELKPDYTEAHFNLANTLVHLGRLDNAVSAYHRTLELDDHFAEAYNNLGSVYREQDNLEKAIECYEKAVAASPGKESASQNLAEALCDFGRQLQAQQNYDDALYYFEQALQINPGLKEARASLSVCHQLLGEDDSALANYYQALQQNPNQPEIHYNLASIYKSQHRFDKAIESLHEAIRLKPDYTDAKYNLANALRETGELHQAMEWYANTIESDKDFYPAYINLAIILEGLGRFSDALNLLEKAKKLNQVDFQVYNNMGIVLQDLHRVDNAIAAYEKALSMSPGNKEVEWNYSLALLLKGDFKNGWKFYESRWDASDALNETRQNYHCPLWRGEDINGKSILLHAEQGLGDTIQFCRFASAVADKGAKVTLLVPASLQRLLRPLRGVQRIITRFERTENFDVHCPLMSLPYLLGLTVDTIPNDVPYLQVDAFLVDAWKRRLEIDNKLRIGIAWAGNPRKHMAAANLVDQRRSMSLKQFEPLAYLPNVKLYNLQKGEAGVQLLTEPIGSEIRDFTFELNDFADTAALIENLDLVITVDTSVAHLAGALGKPVWILSRYDGCWRWLQGRNDSPWYPSARLFRQPTPGAWNTVLNDVVNALQEMTALQTTA